MNPNKLHSYAESEIKRLGLGDSPTNCHGVVAHLEGDRVRLSDGVGLNELVSTRDQVDRELAAVAEWYAEQS